MPEGKSAFLYNINQMIVKAVFLVLESVILAHISNIAMFLRPSAEIVNILACLSKMAYLVTIWFRFT